MEHTKTPWTVEPYLTPDRDDDPIGVYKVEPAHGKLMERYDETDPENDGECFYICHEENQANAEYITRCVNAHEKLVEALKETLGCLIEYYHRYDEMPDNLATQFNIDMESRLERAKSAIALAEK